MEESMRQRALLISLFAVLGFAVLPGIVLAGDFSFECVTERYLSVPLGESHIFPAPLSAVPSGNDTVDVIFEPHLPDGWAAQWCHVSTGLCYGGDNQIRLASGVLDRLDIDIFPDVAVPGMGWVDITVRSVSNPIDAARCTYTLYSGIPAVEDVSFRVDASDNTRRLYTGDYAEFLTPVENTSLFGDVLMVRMIPTVPADWNAFFCQVSTGFCFPGYGEFALGPGSDDVLWVEAYLGTPPSMGALDFVIQSSRNPSIALYPHYRIFLGDWPADVRPAGATAEATTWAEPNPSTGPTSILLRNAAGGTGDLTIFGADGRVVRAFPRVSLKAGAGSVSWDGADDHGNSAPPGIYFYRFLAGGASHRGTLVRTR
jgi:hypothetical protein